MRQSRNSLLFKTKTVKNKQTVKYITRYSQHHLELCNILANHWPLLQADPVLTKYVSIQPEINFRRQRSLRDNLTSSHYSGEQPSRRPQNGITRCGKSAFCPWIITGTRFTLANGELFVPAFHANCHTQGIVYLMSCQCNTFYIGKTARHFRSRIKDHIYYSMNGKMVTAVSRHLDLYHKFDVSLVSFIALAVVPKDLRGGEWDKQILRKETVWIERLNAIHAPGINEAQT